MSQDHALDFTHPDQQVPLLYHKYHSIYAMVCCIKDVVQELNCLVQSYHHAKAPQDLENVSCYEHNEVEQPLGFVWHAKM
jgi:hypothetical protein